LKENAIGGRFHESSAHGPTAGAVDANGGAWRQLLHVLGEHRSIGHRARSGSCRAGSRGTGGGTSGARNGDTYNQRSGSFES
jgi:hypothetical protein